MSNYVSFPIGFNLKIGEGITKKKINSFNISQNQVKNIKDIFGHKNNQTLTHSFEAILFSQTFGSDKFLEYEFNNTNLANKHLRSIKNQNKDFSLNLVDSVDGVIGTLDYAHTFIYPDLKSIDPSKEVLKISRRYFNKKPKYLKDVIRVLDILQKDITHLSIHGGFVRYGEDIRPFINVAAFIEDKYTFMFSNMPYPIEAMGDKGLATHNYAIISSEIKSDHRLVKLPISTLKKMNDFDLERYLKFGDYFRNKSELILENNVSIFGIQYMISKLQEVA